MVILFIIKFYARSNNFKGKCSFIPEPINRKDEFMELLISRQSTSLKLIQQVWRKYIMMWEVNLSHGKVNIHKAFHTDKLYWSKWAWQWF